VRDDDSEVGERGGGGGGGGGGVNKCKINRLQM